VATRPTKTRVKHVTAAANIGEPGGGELAQAMERAIADASLAAGFAEFIAERFLGERLAVGADNESEIPTRSGRQSFRQLGQHRNRHLGAGLCGLQRNDAKRIIGRIADMLLADDDGIATAQAGIKPNLQPDPLAGAKRPVPSIGGNIIFAPDSKAVRLRSLGIINFGGRINLDQLGFLRPPKQPA